MCWIKLDTRTLNKPEVFAMADSLGMPHEVVIVGVLRLWCWAEDNRVGADGVVPHGALCKRTVRDISGVPGLAEAMCKVGWMEARGSEFVFRNYGRHNGEEARKRALNQKQKAVVRGSKTGGM